jgi:hypothetical protein
VDKIQRSAVTKIIIVSKFYIPGSKLISNIKVKSKENEMGGTYSMPGREKCIK